MLDLAIHHGGGPITLADIAQRQGISFLISNSLFARANATWCPVCVAGWWIHPVAGRPAHLRRPGYRRSRRERRHNPVWQGIIVRIINGV